MIYEKVDSIIENLKSILDDKELKSEAYPIDSLERDLKEIIESLINNYDFPIFRFS